MNTENKIERPDTDGNGCSLDCGVAFVHTHPTGERNRPVLYKDTDTCTCASFFTVRGKHKPDCLATPHTLRPVVEVVADISKLCECKWQNDTPIEWCFDYEEMRPKLTKLLAEERKAMVNKAWEYIVKATRKGSWSKEELEEALNTEV